MNYRAILTGGALALAMSLGGVAAANATVVNFDDLVGAGSVADGYGGIIWGGAWIYYDTPESTYAPASGLERVFAAYDNETVGLAPEEAVFKFVTPVTFSGAAFSGASVHAGVTLQMYLGGVLVGSSQTLNQDSTPVFLASGYAGKVDEVRVVGYNGYYVMDDVTYGETVPTTGGNGVPEPATWALMIGGFGMAGAAMRRRRSASATA